MAGGLLTQYFGWRAVFLINPPIIAIMLALVPRLPAGKRSGGGGSVDVRGALLVTTGIAALIFGLSSGQQHGFTAPATIIALALAVLLTTGCRRAGIGVLTDAVDADEPVRNTVRTGDPPMADHPTDGAAPVICPSEGKPPHS